MLPDVFKIVHDHHQAAPSISCMPSHSQKLNLAGILEDNFPRRSGFYVRGQAAVATGAWPFELPEAIAAGRRRVGLGSGRVQIKQAVHLYLCMILSRRLSARLYRKPLGSTLLPLQARTVLEGHVKEDPHQSDSGG